ncbi:hypothetical protein I3843_12G041700 [Carya illinoinensis]|nr:hypothetical protein I3843_12G041700 [Carya illinoinensis]
MRRSSQQQRTADNRVRIEQDTNPLLIASRPLWTPAQRIIPPKQAPSSQLETPAKLPTETSGAPRPKSPEQPTITTPKEPPSGEPQAPPKSGHEPSTPPPLDSSGNPGANASPKQAFVIGVSGGTASGKTAVCNMISDRLLKNSQPRLYTDFRVVVISQDSFYHERSLREEGLEYASEFNFDDPDAFDMEKLLECIKKLKSGQSVQVPHEYTTRKSIFSSLQIFNAN